MAISFEIVQTTARTYAEALFAAAEERGELEEVAEHLDTLLKMTRADFNIVRLLTSQALDDDVRRALMVKIFRGRINDLILNTFLVMNRKGRSGVGVAMVEQFHRLLDEKHGRRQAFVTSAVPLTDDQRERVRQQAERLAKKKPVLQERVDPSLLGGLVLQIGDRVIDVSVKHRLRRLRTELRETLDRQLADAGSRFVSG